MWFMLQAKSHVCFHCSVQPLISSYSFFINISVVEKLNEFRSAKNFMLLVCCVES